jgi:hypothetical protein
MARLGHVVIPGLPHHVTQRGNRREQVFLSEDDYRAYLTLRFADWTAGLAEQERYESGVCYIGEPVGQRWPVGTCRS